MAVGVMGQTVSAIFISSTGDHQDRESVCGGGLFAHRLEVLPPGHHISRWDDNTLSWRLGRARPTVGLGE